MVVGDALKPKKFTFTRAPQKSSEAGSTRPSHAGNVPSQSSSPAAALAATAVPPKPSEPEAGERRLLRRGLSGARITLGAEAQAADVSLEELTDCVLLVRATPRALLIARLTRCTLVCGAVAGAVHLRECTSCTLTLGCQQLRVHSSAQCRAFVRVRALGGAVIEDSQELLFSPWPPALVNILSHVSSVGDADASSGSGASGAGDAGAGAEIAVRAEPTEIEQRCWTDVRDFNWLAADTPSPHWRPLRAEEASPPEFPPAPDWTILLAIDSHST